MPTLTTQHDAQTATELTRTKLADLKVEEQRAKNELVNFGFRVTALINEQKVVESAIEEAGAQRSAMIAEGNETEITKSRKKIMSLKSREEEITESLPLIKAEFQKREREVASKTKETRQLEKHMWGRIAEEIRQTQTPPQVVEFFERLYAAACLEGRGTVQLNSLLMGVFPNGIHPEQVKKRQDALRGEFGI